MTVEPDNVLNDALLLEHARNGDQLAYHALYQSYHSRIYALCLRLLGDRELAMEGSKWKPSVAHCRYPRPGRLHCRGTKKHKWTYLVSPGEGLLQD